MTYNGELKYTYQLIVEYFNLPIVMKGNSFHQQFAKRTSSVAVTSDLFVVWYPGSL